MHGNQLPQHHALNPLRGRKKEASGGMNPAELSRFPYLVREILEESV